MVGERPRQIGRPARSLVLALAACLAALGLVAVPAAAQTYLFQVPEEVVDVFLEADGSLRLVYAITFLNDRGADPIDFVDVGLPTESYDLSSARAWVEGQPLAGIQTSPYVTPGIAVPLGTRSIPPGSRGIVVVEVSGIEDAWYAADDQGFASVNFSPSWFDSQFVSGTTDLTVTFHLPPGTAADGARWHVPGGGWPGSDPATGLDSEGRIVYSWRATTVNAYSQYIFGASVPLDVLPGVSLRTPVSELGTAILGFLAALASCMVPIIPVFVIVGLVIFAQRRSRLAYLPPRISVEGHGIKRGLTAVEAAVLLQTGLDKVLTMILFGLVRKGAARVVREDPLEVEPLAVDVELRGYEKAFLTKVTNWNVRSRRKDFTELAIDLVRSVEAKMKGFGVRETREYYRSIMRKAWGEVEASGTPQVRSERYNEEMEWLMLDRDFGGRTRRTFSSGPVFLPVWWGNYSPAGPSLGSTAPSAKGGSTSLPQLPGADFAASIARGVETGAAALVGNVASFTQGVAKTTNPPPVTRSYGGGSGGSGCACACACAGCACACAGGGR